jgi:hypothetical protein
MFSFNDEPSGGSSPSLHPSPYLGPAPASCSLSEQVDAHIAGKPQNFSNDYEEEGGAGAGERGGLG